MKGAQACVESDDEDIMSVPTQQELKEFGVKLKVSDTVIHTRVGRD